MALKTFKPYTKSTRGTVIVTRQDLWKGKPIKLLTIGKKSSSSTSTRPHGTKNQYFSKNQKVFEK